MQRFLLHAPNRLLETRQLMDEWPFPVPKISKSFAAKHQFLVGHELAMAAD
jgi:hypothetical protein